ncbi:MAG TPA: hypothetical protein VGL86_09795, partial [Polyangia bacterium]
MAGVDSLLRILEQHDADELRLATDQPPRMFQRGSPVRLSFPPTPDEMLRHLVDPLLTAEREALLRSRGRVELIYAPDDGAHSFAVTIERRGAGEPLAFEVTMRRGAPRAANSAPPRTASSAPARAANSPATSAPPPRATPPPPPPRAEPSAPPPASIAVLLQQACARGASDVHLRNGDPTVLRIDGRLHALPASSAVDVDELLAWLPPDRRALI